MKSRVWMASLWEWVWPQRKVAELLCSATLLPCAAWLSGYPLRTRVGVAAATRCAGTLGCGAGSRMRSAGTRGCGVRSGMRCAGTRARRGMRGVRAIRVSCAGTRRRGTRSAIGIRTIGRSTATTVISSAPTIGEAMAAPAVTVAPAGPWAHAEEDAVVKVSRPVESDRRALVGSIVVVAVGADRLDADFDDD